MISTLLTLTIVLLFQLLFYAWWWIIPIPMIIGFLERDSISKASGGTGLGVFILWFGMSLFQWNSGGEIIVGRIAEVMGTGSGFVLALATGFLGFIVAAIAGYGGFSLRKLLVKEYQV